MDTHKLLTDFASLLNAGDSPTQSSTIESFLSLLDQEMVRAIRRSAIPHEVTPTLLQILIPELPPEDAKDLCEKIGAFSFVIPEGDRFSFHDQTRQELFEWWLAKGDPALFARLSLSLVGTMPRSWRRCQKQTAPPIRPRSGNACTICWARTRRTASRNSSDY